MRLPRTLLFIFCFVAAAQAFAQQKLLITGKVTHAEDGTGFPDVMVVVKDQPGASTTAQKITRTGNSGVYALYIDRLPVTLTFNFLSYETAVRKITADELSKISGDTLRIDVSMKRKITSIDTLVITPHSPADTVIGNWRFFIEDYAIVAPERYVLLTWEKSLKNANVMLAAETGGVLAKQEIPGEAVELFVDYESKVNILTKDAVYRVLVDSNQLRLQQLPLDQFRDRIMPCLDTLGGKIFFTNYHRDYPAFSYFTYDPKDSTVRKLRNIVDSDLLSLYNWEFDYLKPKERLYARKMELATGIDKRIIAATMTGFTQTHYYTPLYAPAFVVHDTICVFDHYANKLFRYDASAKLLDSVKIEYHHPKNWREWDRLVLCDEVSGEIYALHEKGGFKYLKHVNLKTGQVDGTYKISNQFVKHLHIYNGEVYYIFRPYDSTQKKFLYREKIILTD